MSAILTLELDDSAAHSLQSLADSWHVAPQEAIKRAVKAAAKSLQARTPSEALSAFRQLQQAANLTPEQATEWKRSVADARR
jgi:predicted transcriptional regulator